MRRRGELGPPDVRRAIFLLLPRARMRRRGELGPPDVRRAIFFSFFEFASDVAANSAHLMSGGPIFLLLPRARMRRRGELGPPDVRRAVFLLQVWSKYLNFKQYI